MAGEGHAYLRNWLWWVGMIMMILGEICNFVAFGEYTFLAICMLLRPWRLTQTVSTLSIHRCYSNNSAGCDYNCGLRHPQQVLLEREFNVLCEFPQKTLVYLPDSKYRRLPTGMDGMHLVHSRRDYSRLECPRNTERDYRGGTTEALGHAWYVCRFTHNVYRS